MYYYIMTGGELRTGRKQRGWTQTELAERLGVSQGYVCLLERAQRPVPAALAQKATRLLDLPATALPLGSTSTALADDAVTTALATLGYPGFAYRRRRQGLNPAEVLLRSLKTANLDARVVEALVWVALTYANLDWDWLVRQAKVEDLQNRLGFLVTLARQLAEQRDNAEAVPRLTRAEQALEYSRLQREDAFRVSMTEAERRWLREHRSPEATRWNVLTSLNASELARGF
jgi:transcriptional regulator with XRE-family HTH domain